MNVEDLEIIKEQIAFSIKENVNGKIDKIQLEITDNHEKHRQDMERILPIIEAYEASEQAVNAAKKGGKVVIGIATFISALGGAYLILKQVF